MSLLETKVWRQILVRSDATFQKLHDVIQVAMGWYNSHLYQFRKGNDFYIEGYKNEFDDFGSHESVLANKITLAEYFGENKSIIYTYDMGDSWDHEVKLLAYKSSYPQEPIKHAICVSGANRCPPEDCGGVPGFYNLLEAQDDPKHEEHQSFKEWLGGEFFDSNEFYIDEINGALKRVKFKLSHLKQKKIGKTKNLSL